MRAPTHLALVTWSVRDPSLNHATAGPIRNLLGYKGAIVADLTMQLIGVAAVALLTPPVIWSWGLIRRRRLDSPRLRLILWIGGTFCAAGLAALFPVTDRWPLPSGLGGVFGDALLSLPRHAIGGSHVAVAIAAAILLVGDDPLHRRGLFEPVRAATRTKRKIRKNSPRGRRAAMTMRPASPGFFLVALGALIHGALSGRAALRRSFRQRQAALAEAIRQSRVEQLQPAGLACGGAPRTIFRAADLRSVALCAALGARAG